MARHGVGHLMAVIPDAKGQPRFYYLIPVDVPSGHRCWRLTRKAGGRATKTYTVARDDKGHYSCSCPDFVYAHDNRGRCKHINALVAFTLLAPIPGAAQDKAAQQRGQGRNHAVSIGRERREAGPRTATG